MDKVEDYLSKIPDMMIDFINKQTGVRACEEYFAQVERQINHYKKYGTFKIPPASTIDNNIIKQPLCESQGTRQPVLNENSQIKMERISEVPLKDTVAISANRESLKENIKNEKLDMPPPQLPVKKIQKIKKEPRVTNTRSTRSKASKKKERSDSISRDSDVILKKQTIETITLLDSDEENEQPPVRVTRTKTRQKKKQNDGEENVKRSRSPSTDADRKTRPTRQIKRKKSKESPPKETSVYEDAESNFTDLEKNKVDKTVTKENFDETYVTDKKNSEHDEDLDGVEKDAPEEVAISNQTVVISNPKVLKNVTPPNVRDIMTDDEDDNITVTVTKNVTKLVKKGAKAIFSPFEGSPVKKRVEAFEKLGAETTSEIPIRTAKSRTRIFNRETQDYNARERDHRDKNLTPQMANRYLAAISSSATKATRTNFINESFISTKSASALKASQQEYKEREIRRREKETEAIRKRDALIQAQIEEKKKKRLEKQNKAQQTREVLEKNKMKNLEEVERAKEEKRKQVLAEKQEKIRKQQEDTERRRVEVLKKAAEEKRKEEERKRAAEEEQQKLKRLELKKAYKNKGKRIPLYLREKAPLLPTADCYDSDDETSHTGAMKPAWASRERMEEQLQAIKFISKDVVSNCFVLDVITPDLRDIFEYIDPRKLKRTSSAVWKVAPRFTMMPESIKEDGEEE